MLSYKYELIYYHGETNNAYDLQHENDADVTIVTNP